MASQLEKEVGSEYPKERIQEFLDVAMDLVSRASGCVKEALSKRDKNVETKSSATDLVTETDKAMEKLLVGGLQAKFPDHKFIGEEDTAENKGNDVGEVTDSPTWIIDPIDGTTNFVHGHPMVCISVGLIIKRIPWIGIVSVPMTNSTYHAVRSQGAFLNGNKIKASKTLTMSKAMVLNEMWARCPPSVMKSQLDNTAIFMNQAQAIRTLGSAAINLVMIANGEADVYPQVGIRCWDIVAGGLIVKEAGGTLLDPRDGSDYDYMSRAVLACATPELAKEVIDLGLAYPDCKRDHEEKFMG